jgi:hypothetical protein
MDWESTSLNQVEIPFKPARVILQVCICFKHFTWIPVNNSIPCTRPYTDTLKLGFHWCPCSCGLCKHERCNVSIRWQSWLGQSNSEFTLCPCYSLVFLHLGSSIPCDWSLSGSWCAEVRKCSAGFGGRSKLVFTWGLGTSGLSTSNYNNTCWGLMELRTGFHMGSWCAEVRN